MAPIQFKKVAVEEESKRGKKRKRGVAESKPEPVVSIASRSFEQAFKNIDDVLRKEAGCTTELDYTEQTSWLLFLKYLDALVQDKAAKPSCTASCGNINLDAFEHERFPCPPAAEQNEFASTLEAHL